jgi:hypothetical protein
MQECSESVDSAQLNCVIALEEEVADLSSQSLLGKSTAQRVNQGRC